MIGLRHVVKGALWASIGAAAILLAGCASMSSSRGANVALSGSQEVPPVTTGVNGTAARIHLAALGQHGPVIVPRP